MVYTVHFVVMPSCGHGKLSSCKLDQGVSLTLAFYQFVENMKEKIFIDVNTSRHLLTVEGRPLGHLHVRDYYSHP